MPQSPSRSRGAHWQAGPASSVAVVCRPHPLSFSSGSPTRVAQEYCLIRLNSIAVARSTQKRGTAWPGFLSSLELTEPQVPAFHCVSLPQNRPPTSAREYATRLRADSDSRGIGSLEKEKQRPAGRHDFADV